MVFLRPGNFPVRGKLLNHGYGIINIVEHATAPADELHGPEELAKGGALLEEKIRNFKPLYAAIMGMGRLRGLAFRRPKARLDFSPKKSRIFRPLVPQRLTNYQLKIVKLEELKAAVWECGTFSAKKGGE